MMGENVNIPHVATAIYYHSLHKEWRTIIKRGSIVRSNVFSSRTWVTLGLILFGVLVLSSMVSWESEGVVSSTITVEKDGRGNYTSIQEAIDNAEELVRIVVGEGTFPENIVVNKLVSIVGAGAGKTIIEGQGGNDVVSISSDGVVFRGISVTSGENEGAGIAIHANGTYIFDTECSNKTVGIIVNGSSNWVQNSTCSNNSDTGIQVISTHREGLESCVIMNNTCSSNWNYGIHIQRSDDVYVLNNRFDFNTYGVYGSNLVNVSLFGNECDDNQEHGILIIRGNNVSISTNKCINNVNGIFISQSDHNVIQKNNLTANVKGLYLSNSKENKIIKNRCSNNQEGINLETSESNEVLGNNVSNNDGNGIHLSNDASNNRLEFNSVYDNGERGLYVRASSSHNVIENNTFVGNRIGIRIVQSSTNNSVRSNNIFNNCDWGIYVGDESEAVNASGSWWWFPSGPYHETENPEGEGDNISDYVSFLPVKTKRINQRPTVTIEQPRDLEVTINEGTRITFVGDGEDWGEVVRYVWRSSKDGELYNGSDQGFSTSELSPGEHVISLRVQDDLGAWSEEVSVRVTVVENEEGMSSGVVVAIIVVIVLVIVGGLVQAGVVPLKGRGGVNPAREDKTPEEPEKKGETRGKDVFQDLAGKEEPRVNGPSNDAIVKEEPRE